RQPRSPARHRQQGDVYAAQLGHLRIDIRVTREIDRPGALEDVAERGTVHPRGTARPGMPHEHGTNPHRSQLHGRVRLSAADISEASPLQVPYRSSLWHDQLDSAVEPLERAGIEVIEVQVGDEYPVQSADRSWSGVRDQARSADWTGYSS